MEIDTKVAFNSVQPQDKEGIGSVALAWSTLEWFTELISWRVAGLNRLRGIAITTHMSMPQRLDVMLSLLDTALQEKQIPQQIYSDAKKESKHIKNNLAPKRNKIVHSRIVNIPAFDAHNIRKTYKARGRVETDDIPATQKEYEDITDEILDSANRLTGLLRQIEALIPRPDDAQAP